MSTKIQKRLDAIDKEIERFHELFGQHKYRSGSTMHDLHTMILNTDFLIFSIKEMGEARVQMEQQHQQQMQSLFTRVNLQDSFIKSKGLLNEYNLYKKDFLEKQEEKRKEAEAKAKAEAATEGSDRAASDDAPPGREDNPA